MKREIKKKEAEGGKETGGKKWSVLTVLALLMRCFCLRLSVYLCEMASVIRMSQGHVHALEVGYHYPLLAPWHAIFNYFFLRLW